MSKDVMKILITGSAGYIGSVIVNLALQNNYQVQGVDTLWFDEKVPLIHVNNPNYKFFRGNINNADLLNICLEGVDFVIHTAAVVGDPASKKFPELTYKTNYEASIKLIKMVQDVGVKGFIFFSTCSSYGISDGVATEETQLKPLSLYAQTKVNVEKYLMDKAKNLDWVICRLSTAYGVSPRMRFDLTVNDFTMNAYMKKYLDIFLPLTFRPYIHVYDIARVVIEILKNFDKVKNNVFNLGFNEENYQKIEIANIIKKLMPEIKINIVERGTDIRDYKVDFSKLQRFSNIKNRFMVADGTREIFKLLKDDIIIDPYEKRYYNTDPCLEEEKAGTFARKESSRL